MRTALCSAVLVGLGAAHLALADLDLPVLGRIRWERPCATIPFVPPWPSGGLSGMVTVPFEGKIIVAGGFIPAGDENKKRTSQWVHRYDPATKQWTRLSDMPIRREYLRGAVCGKAIYIMGGACQLPGEDPEYAPFADCIKLVPEGNDFRAEPIAPLSDPRTHMAAGAVGPYIVVAGGNHYKLPDGYTKDTLRDLTEVFDTRHPEKGWRIGKPIPSGPAGWQASAVVGDRLYVFGAQVLDAKGNWGTLADAWSYDPARDKWERLPDLPFDISAMGAAYADRYVFLLGGARVSNAPEAQGGWIWGLPIVVYDTQTRKYFTVAGRVPTPGDIFGDVGVIFIGDTIYVVGGEGPGGTHYNWFRVGRFKLR